MLCYSLSHVQLFATPWTVAHHAPLSIEFSRQEYWSGLPFHSPGTVCIKVQPNSSFSPVHQSSSELFLGSCAVEACCILKLVPPRPGGEHCPDLLPQCSLPYLCYPLLSLPLQGQKRLVLSENCSRDSMSSQPSCTGLNYSYGVNAWKCWVQSKYANGETSKGDELRFGRKYPGEEGKGRGSRAVIQLKVSIGHPVQM